MKHFTRIKKFIATLSAIAMVIALSPANDVFADGAADFNANGFLYGYDMNDEYQDGTIGLRADLLETSETFGNDFSEITYSLVTAEDRESENYTATEANVYGNGTGLAEIYTSLVDGNWYKIVATNGVDTAETEAVQALFLDAAAYEGGFGTVGSGENELYVYGSYMANGWYLSNGAMAYRIFLGEGGYDSFNVIGKYEDDEEGECWIGTSYNGKWDLMTSDNDENAYIGLLDNLRVSFETNDVNDTEKNPYLVNFSADVRDDMTSFGFYTDTMLGNYGITDYSDIASLKEINNSNGDPLKVQMVGNVSAAEADASDPAFVISYDANGHLPDYENIAFYDYPWYFTNNTMREWSLENMPWYDPENDPPYYYECDTWEELWEYYYAGGQYLYDESVGRVIELRNIDSGMATTWTNIDGEEINFSFSIGSVATTKADKSRSALDGEEPAEEEVVVPTSNETILNSENVIDVDGQLAELTITDWNGKNELDAIEEVNNNLKADEEIVNKICTDYMAPEAKIVDESGEKGLHVEAEGDSTLLFAYQEDDGTYVESEVKYIIKSTDSVVPEIDMKIVDKDEFGKNGIKIKDYQEVTVIEFDYKDITGFTGTMRIEKKENLDRYFVIGYKADGSTVLVPCWEDKFNLTFEISSDIVQLALVGTYVDYVD